MGLSPDKDERRGAGRPGWTQDEPACLTALSFYGVIALVGWLLYAMRSQDAPAVVLWPADWGDSLLTIACGAGFIMCLAWLVEGMSPSFQRVRLFMSEHLGRLALPDLMLIGLLAAVGEEVLFRVGLQDHLGIVLTSLVFAASHVGPFSGERWHGGVFLAFVGGLVVGLAYMVTREPLVAIAIHGLPGMVGLWRLRRQYLSRQRQARVAVDDLRPPQSTPAASSKSDS